MIKVWDDEAWDDYIAWQSEDKKTLKRINTLIKDIERNGVLEGIGQPEPLKHDLSGWYSRRIDSTNRLIYRIVENQIEIAQCKTHYGSH
jgi:toxin YoeB